MKKNKSPYLAYLYKKWMQFAEILGWVNSRIILGFIFFFLLMPLGLILRLSRDPMQRQFNHQSKSYRIKSTNPKTANFPRPF